MTPARTTTGGGRVHLNVPDIEPFYWRHVRRDHVTHEALSWIGTPFHPFAEVKGSGVDCIHLIAAIYRETGFIQDFNPPSYSIGGGSHQDSSQIEAYIRGLPNLPLIFEHGQCCVECLPALWPQLLPGDLLLFQIGRVTHHTGMVTRSPRFIHSMHGYGVTQARLTDATFGTRLRRVYRPMTAAHSLNSSLVTHHSS